MCAKVSREAQLAALEIFYKYVITQAKSNLTRMEINVSDKLYNSLQGEASVGPNSIQASIEMEVYGRFRDKGVSGADPGYKYNTPYSYKDKAPPPSAFDQWIVRRGIAPRNAKGQFSARKALAWAISRSVYKKGIKPSLFFTKPFEAAYERLPNEIVEAYGLDLENFMVQVLDAKKI